MGGAASIHIHPPHITHSYFKELLGSKQLRNDLFDDIVAKGDSGRITLKNKLNINKLTAFFIDPSNSNLSDFHVDVTILNSALKKCSKRKPHDQLTRKEFHVFLPTLFLFSKLHVIFDEMDKEVVKDNKIFKGEFIKSKHSLTSVEGIEVLHSLSDEEWANEFELLDSIKKDGYVSFDEFCKYSLQHLVKTDKFIAEFIDSSEDHDELNEEALDEAIESLHATHEANVAMTDEELDINKGSCNTAEVSHEGSVAEV